MLSIKLFAIEIIKRTSVLFFKVGAFVVVFTMFDAFKKLKCISYCEPYKDIIVSRRTFSELRRGSVLKRK